jgi:hypothetical protein
MAAGLGFKTFTTGEVLTAADTNGYLMQGVLVFASAAARDAAITSPQEGQFAYLKDTNVTTYYTGSAWANLDTTGMTNPMTTTGDTIYSSSGSTPARLGIGSTGQVLTVAGGIPSWAAPAGGGKVLKVVMGTINSETTTTSTSLVDTGLTATITPTSATSKVLVLVSHNGVTPDTTSGQTVKLALFRGASEISKITDRQGWTNSSLFNNGSVSFNYEDTPATTSATTYKTQFARTAGSGTVYVQNSAGANGAVSTIILMEIGA